ncbi:hypothetical protein MLD38_021794 [Melastoma candidum]|uniref:Uncharacterized protein n=1 Tax=Melastoma candidum TaxID=119954 RepID=A0ACB9QH92_9MYRT|nr:hypothetical protein MLD38_021794 [Melastoma candidum]
MTIYAAESVLLIGKLIESENALRGRPTASASVVESLPCAVLVKEDAEKNDGLCPVYRNSCPVCRYKLPTDDLDDDSRRTRWVYIGFCCIGVMNNFVDLLQLPVQGMLD